MSKEVICINDKNLPEGAHVVKDQKYTVEKEFMNNFGQRAYLLVGAVNGGTTSKGFQWYGYDAARFRVGKGEQVEIEEHAFALN